MKISKNESYSYAKVLESQYVQKRDIYIKKNIDNSIIQTMANNVSSIIANTPYLLEKSLDYSFLRPLNVESEIRKMLINDFSKNFIRFDFYQTQHLIISFAAQCKDLEELTNKIGFYELISQFDE